MVTEGKEKPLTTIVAELAWLDVDQAQIEEACKGHKGVTFKKGGTLRDTLVAANMGVLIVDEDEALTILSQRVVSGKRDDDASVDALMQIDEAAKVLDEKDEGVLKGEQKNAAVYVATHDEFVPHGSRPRAATSTVAGLVLAAGLLAGGLGRD